MSEPTTLVLLARATESMQHLLHYVFAPAFLTNWRQVPHFWIICPQADAPLMAPLAERLGATLRHDEEFPNIKLLPPYQRQIAIKLLVAEHVTTPTYLTLDCDCLFLPPGPAALFNANGKPYLHPNFSQNYYHRYWLENCNPLTGNQRFVEPMMGFTPQLFITRHVRALCDGVAQQAESDFITAILRWEQIYRARVAPVQANVAAIDHTVLKPALVSDALLRVHHAWTEYALYWSYILAHGLEGDYATSQPLCDKFFMGKNWSAHIGHTIPTLSEAELEFDLLAEGFFNYRAPLAVIQSTAGADWQRVTSVLARYGLIDVRHIMPRANEQPEVQQALAKILAGERIDPLPTGELV